MTEKLVFGIYYDDETGNTHSKVEIPHEAFANVYMMIENEKEFLRKKWNDYTFGVFKEDVEELI